MSTISSNPPRAALLAIGVILAFEALLRWAPIDPVWRALHRYSDPKWEDALRFFAQTETLPPNAVVVMGSSQAREAVDSRVLNRPVMMHEYPVINLAVSDGAILDLYVQLDRVLPHKPRVLVVMPLWPSFYLDYDSRKLRYYVYSLSTLTSLAELYGPDQFWRRLGKGLLGVLPAFVSPTCRFGKSLHASFLRMLTERRAEPELFAYHESRPPEYFEAEIRQPKQPVLRVTRETAAEQALFVRFVERVRAAGTTLLIVDAPMHPAFYTVRPSYPEGLADYRAFMERVSRERGVAYFSYDEMPQFGAEDFIDFSHLNAEGRKKMTGFLAGPLQDALHQ